VEAAELIAFEREVAERFDAGEISGPCHLNSETQAAPLIEIFRDIKRTDYVLSTWRGHWHALLHGVPRDKVMAEILAGRSMMLHFPEYRFMSSAIVGGMLPIACGLAAGGERVWCFVGDMAASIGTFSDALLYTVGHRLNLTFIIEDNGLATNTPTDATWGISRNYPDKEFVKRYSYQRTVNHYQQLPDKGGF
jgi:TPP-dependent pyruvate/acetoin dehydrogenase alpha subunit